MPTRCLPTEAEGAGRQGWLRQGHCHAHDKDAYWKALREFTKTEMLCNSPLLQALGCDEAARSEAHRWCINGLLAFHKYRDGEPAPGGIISHSFQHVTDVASRSPPPPLRGLGLARGRAGGRSGGAQGHGGDARPGGAALAESA